MSTRTWRIAAALGCALALAGGLVVGLRERTGVAPPPPPPVAWPLGCFTTELDTRELPLGVSCGVSLEEGVRRVRLTYAVLRGHPWSDGRPPVERVDLGTPYWPTTARWIDDARLAVGGVTVEDGRALVEVWDFDGDPDRPRVELDPDRSRGRFRWVLPARTRTREVWRAAEPGTGAPHGLLELRGGAPALLVQLAPGGDVLAVDGRTGGAEPLVSRRLGARLLVHDLDADLRLLRGIDHPEDGLVYELAADFVRHAWRTLYLLDLDRDGSIDTYARGEDLVDGGRYLADELWARSW